jgi:hypothetical protein
MHYFFHDFCSKLCMHLLHPMCATSPIQFILACIIPLNSQKGQNTFLLLNTYSKLCLWPTQSHIHLVSGFLSLKVFLHLLPRLRTSGSVPLILLHASMTGAGNTALFMFTLRTCQICLKPHHTNISPCYDRTYFKTFISIQQTRLTPLFKSYYKLRQASPVLGLIQLCNLLEAISNLLNKIIVINLFGWFSPQVVKKFHSACRLNSLKTLI